MAVKKTFAEWVEFYEKKTGLKYTPPDKRAKLLFFPDRGFAEFGVTKDMVVIGQLAGDAKFWKQVGEVMAQERGLNHLGTWCVRNIESYIRFFDVEIQHVEEVGDGLKRYFGKFKDSGKKALFSPQGKMAENDKIRYLVTWEI